MILICITIIELVVVKLGYSRKIEDRYENYSSRHK